MRSRKAAGIIWLITFSCLAAATDSTIAAYPVDSMGDMMPRWDEANHRVLSYQLQNDSGQVAVQITSTDRSRQTVKISVLKDFPGAVQAILNGVAPGPDQSVVVACGLKYPDPTNERGAFKVRTPDLRRN
jgi:hypothetical protein